MSKEKIVFNKTELFYDRIGFSGNALVIGFKAGNVAEIENVFRAAGQDGLERIEQYDVEGNLQTTHERYDIFAEIRKEIGATAEEDVVEVVLNQEDELKMEIRHLKANQAIQDGAIEDLGNVVSGLAEAAV